MSNVKSMKDTLELSYTTYKRNKSALSRALSNLGMNSSTRILTIKVNSLEESLNALNVSHTSWVSKAEFSSEELAAETYSNEWLETRWEEADELIDKAKAILAPEEVTEPPTVSVNQKLVILEKQLDSLQLNITEETNALMVNTEVELQLLIQFTRK